MIMDTFETAISPSTSTERATDIAIGSTGWTATLETGRAECPAGFQAGGVHAGLRRSGKRDLALFLCPKGAAAAGVFTQNLLRAAPVEISERHLKATLGRAKAIVINSAYANAATGEEGFRRAERMAAAVSERFDAPIKETLIASTGVIGPQLPIEQIVNGLDALDTAISAAGMQDAAEAIMTTDLVSKSAQVTLREGERTVTIAGVAKGSGMIHPNMATMLGVALTDADVEPGALHRSLRAATDRTFNRISVDGDTSTNDCVFAMASGEAGAMPQEVFDFGLELICRDLAMQIVRDGEGARKVIRVRAQGAAEETHAAKISETVARSMLVRTAVAGGDPNWGRILAAIGRAGAPVDLDSIEVLVGGISLYRDGAPAAERSTLFEAFAGPEVEIEIRLNAGDERAEYLTCDLTDGYIRINALYTT